MKKYQSQKFCDTVPLLNAFDSKFTLRKPSMVTFKKSPVTCFGLVCVFSPVFCESGHGNHRKKGRNYELCFSKDFLELHRVSTSIAYFQKQFKGQEHICKEYTTKSVWVAQDALLPVSMTPNRKWEKVSRENFFSSYFVLTLLVISLHF
jgi:hypothetical protein